MKDGIDPADAIHLPFPEPPALGEVVRIADGLLWARMALPVRLNHVNVWLLDDGDGWTAVDCGLDSADTRAAWEQLAAGPLQGRPLRRLVATHGHVDHVGLAGWFAQRFHVPFHATRTAWLWARVTAAARHGSVSEDALRHLRAQGCDAKDIDDYANNRGPLHDTFGDPPRAHIRLKDGDGLRMGGRDWSVITADGHADEHASFASQDSQILIAGDQILQRISPVVGVFSGEPLADPLTDYVTSLERFKTLPETTLVLPSHGLPFVGLLPRIAQLQHHHEQRLDIALKAMDRPITGTECARVMFARAVSEGQWYLALGETLAHLHRLVTLGLAERQVGSDGVIRFARK